jgi:hypothetical protein
MIPATQINYAKIKKSSMKLEKKKPVQIKSFQTNNDNLDLLQRCSRYYDSLYEFRKKRQRCRDYHAGKQWNDLIYVNTPLHKGWISEEDYIKLQGRVPLKQNRIREKVKNLVGQWRTNDIESMVLARAKENTEASEMMSNALQYVLQFNRMDELDSRTFVEFALSGMGIWKSCFKWMKERNMSDVFSESPNPSRMFFNSDIEDFRLTDLRLIGQIIDASKSEILGTFAKNPSEAEQIKEIYAGWSTTEVNTRGLSSTNIDNLSFLVPSLGEKWRLFEIWELKRIWRMYVWDPIVGKEDIYDLTEAQINAANAERRRFAEQNGVDEETIQNKVLLRYEQKLEQVWYYKFLTPSGHCLAEGESPYEHEEHPFTILLDPLIDGEIWGFVYDFLDQQRYINRLTILMDWIIQSSAKGVLLVPKSALGDNSVEEFAQQWAQFDGVIAYEAKQGVAPPEQISANSTNIGLQDLIAMQMNFMDGVSGIHPAQQGMQAPAGTPGNRYAMEAQNASLNTVDIMKKFLDAKQVRDLKLIKLIRQYYQEERWLAISGRSQMKLYDPKKIGNIDFEYKVAQGNNTPVFRQAQEELLAELRREGSISIKTYLETSSTTFADKLLDVINKEEQNQIDPNLMAQVQAGTTPQKQNILSQAIGKVV